MCLLIRRRGSAILRSRGLFISIPLALIPYFPSIKSTFILSPKHMVNFNIPYNYDPQTKQYIAEIPQLNLSDFGDTIDEAEKNVKQALKAYLEEVYASKFTKKEVEYA